MLLWKHALALDRCSSFLRVWVVGSKPKPTDVNFDDLLSGQGFTGSKEKKGPKTIAEMRKEEMAKEMDPEKLKVKLKDDSLGVI